MTVAPKTRAVIVGTGIFGMSTALWMLEDGGYEVVMLDKCDTLPAPDAASTDLNKIIRASDYADPALASLALEAVHLWRKPEWDNTLHESGFIALSRSGDASAQAFVTKAFANSKNLGTGVTLTPDGASIKAFVTDVPTGGFGGREGYYNPMGGWAEAGRAVEVGHERIRKTVS
ncbi:hypothetical protein P7C73_g6825, partial [Tremellales sp. Uapishka_1]